MGSLDAIRVKLMEDMGNLDIRPNTERNQCNLWIHVEVR